MINSSSPVAVVGAGAIGGVVATLMARAGRKVEVVCKHREIADRALYPGFHVYGMGTNETVKLEAVTNISDVSGGKDVVFLATKANEAIAAAKQLPAILSEDGVVVTMQNGIIEEEAAAILAPRRVVGCVLGWGATMIEPGEVELTSPGGIAIGHLDGSVDQGLEELRGFLDLVRPTRISNNIMGELWSKLIVDCCINSLGAVTGLDVGQLGANRKARALFMAITGEGVRVGTALGVNIESSTDGKIDFKRLAKGGGLLAAYKRHCFVKAVSAAYSRIQSPSLQSLQRGRPTEVDYLNAYICRKGAEVGQPTPVNAAIVEMIRGVESGDRRISAGNLEQLPLS